MKKFSKQAMAQDKIEKLVNLLFEARILKYLERASSPYLKGPTKEGVAEHCFFTTLISWVLARLEGLDENKIIKMALIHDLAEARAGEKNLINKFYSAPIDELRVIEDISQDCGLEDFKLAELFKEFLERKTKESQIVQDADVLAGMLREKECLDSGNQKAQKWLDFSLARVKTKWGRELAKRLREADSDQWWLQIVKRYLNE